MDHTTKAILDFGNQIPRLESVNTVYFDITFNLQVRSATLTAASTWLTPVFTSSYIALDTRTYRIVLILKQCEVIIFELIPPKDLPSEYILGSSPLTLDFSAFIVENDCNYSIDSFALSIDSTAE